LTNGRPLPGEQMKDLIKTLEEKGFFELKSEYRNEEPLAGGRPGRRQW
jgi:hypothetical protein